MPWQLDEWNPYENAFERSLIEELKPGVLEVVWGMLDELVKQPLRGNPISFVAGKPIRIVSTGPIESGGKIIPPLRIIYALHEEQKLVQPVLICASDESQEGAALEAKALVEQTPSSEELPRRTLLGPLEPTSIPKEEIEAAVDRVLGKR